MTIYTIQPVKDGGLKAGTELLVVDLFPPNVRLVMLRYAGVYVYCGFVEGDGAVALRREGARRLRVLEVSDISGCGKAVVKE